MTTRPRGRASGGAHPAGLTLLGSVRVTEGGEGSLLHFGLFLVLTFDVDGTVGVRVGGDRPLVLLGLHLGPLERVGGVVGHDVALEGQAEAAPLLAPILAVGVDSGRVVAGGGPHDAGLDGGDAPVIVDLVARVGSAGAGDEAGGEGQAGAAEVVRGGESVGARHRRDIQVGRWAAARGGGSAVRR